MSKDSGIMGNVFKCCWMLQYRLYNKKAQRKIDDESLPDNCHYVRKSPL